MAARKKFQDMIVHHRNMEVKLTYKDGFAPTWEAYVKWPGYKNRKYFTSVSAWNHMPSKAIDVVKKRIDIQLNLAWIDVTFANNPDEIKRFRIKSYTDKGRYTFREGDVIFGYCPEDPVVEYLDRESGVWFVYRPESTSVTLWTDK